jgi:hypothetical protein
MGLEEESKKSKMKTDKTPAKTIYLRIWLLALLLLAGLWCQPAEAASVASSRAHKLVRTWLAENARPMDSLLGSEVNNVEAFNDSAGQPLYYVVYLNPNGFVIVPADDEVEPVICFSSQGRYEPSERNPLGALVSRDLPARVDAVRAVKTKTLSGRTALSLTENETANLARRMALQRLHRNLPAGFQAFRMFELRRFCKPNGDRRPPADMPAERYATITTHRRIVQETQTITIADVWLPRWLNI